VNTFNRLVTILVIIVVFIVATIGLVAPTSTLRLIKITVDGALDILQRLRPGPIAITFHALLVACAVLLDILLIVLLMLERRPQQHAIPVQKVGGGAVSVTAESLAERLQYHLGQLADVIGTKARVALSRRGGVELDLDVRVSADVNIPEKADQILEVARQVVEDKMGLRLARKPRVYIQAAPHPGLSARPPAASPTASQALQPIEPAAPFSPVTGEEK